MSDASCKSSLDFACRLAPRLTASIARRATGSSPAMMGGKKELSLMPDMS